MNQLPQTTAVLVVMLVFAGCRSAPKDTSEMDAILKTVVYDTSVPVIPASFPVAYSSSTPATSEPAASAPKLKVTFAERTKATGRFVGDGLKATAGFILLGGIKIVEASLGLGDDDSTSYGSADRKFNQWLDDRDRWRKND
ncbi:hypothetical protein [Rhodopirellula sp. P2]|uniref:hypothetical protein n=1 Tax=Rhodopirellula sp. P2 TaxID=2127060 RepID=UPI002368A975|nr:hypothetical protein [Rhodopirellula sp. P2]WDQ15473.1 hypothetical protein PSR62_17730 [Rhodopirellula sp. P2]